MKTDERIAAEIDALYRWIDAEIERTQVHTQPCEQCGQCCDFEGYDHRLYVTSAELTHFLTRTSRSVPEPTAAACPFNVEGACTVHAHRFAACRIFSCRGDTDAQARISEQVIDRLKRICERFGLPYRYVNLMHAASL